MELSIIQKSFDTYKDLYCFTQQLPKEHKFIIGKDIMSSFEIMYQNILFAKHNPKHHKFVYLLKALVYSDILKSQIRLCLELKLGTATTIFKLNNQTTEIQRMLGGWKKSL
jgi:four helix bundle protein